ncbi:MAG: CCA tRNA nucleotidyltransferase [Candidatus Stahlbacteria bacterium]|nr:MAG: CCA tRNA nucleotidyltransferase [Candidatus Stahlbacteria bacterium]
MAKLKSLAKHQKKSVLNKTINFFVKSNFHAYLVGGYVRDTTLGIKPIDIDTVVEGNAIKAAKALNLKLKGKLCIYKEFGTASIITKAERIDLASARVEKYPSPAKLPHVYPSTIIEDLNRRDFTINAMAMSISKEDFGEIFDPFNGLEDIKKGLIRVLHKNSFNDDPTRIFRALRYKNRFGFKIEKKTKIIMKEAIDKKMIKQLTGQRILNEIRLIFTEKKYQETIKDLSDLIIFKIKKKDWELLPLLGPNRIYLYLSKLDTNEFPLKTEERKIMHDLNKTGSIISRLEKTSKNSIIYNILYPISDQVIDMIPLIRPELKKKINIYFRLKKIKPFIKGNDLKNLKVKQGRKFKILLKKMLDLQLDKKINSRKDALQYLKNLKNNE